MKLTLKKRLTIYILAISVGIFLITIFVIIPGVEYIINLRNDIKHTQAELDNSYNRAKQLRRSIQEIDNVKENIKKFKDVALPTNQELNIITEMENLAATHNIEQNMNINYIDIKKNTEAKNKPPNSPTQISGLHGYYQLSFLNNGNFVDHLKYLEAMEKKPYYVIINDLNFEKRRNDTSTSTPVTLQFNAIIYAE